MSTATKLAVIEGERCGVKPWLVESDRAPAREGSASSAGISSNEAEVTAAPTEAAEEETASHESTVGGGDSSSSGNSEQSADEEEGWELDESEPGVSDSRMIRAYSKEGMPARFSHGKGPGQRSRERRRLRRLKRQREELWAIEGEREHDEVTR